MEKPQSVNFIACIKCEDINAYEYRRLGQSITVPIF